MDKNMDIFNGKLMPIEEISAPDAHENITVIEERSPQDEEKTSLCGLARRKFFMVVLCGYSYHVSFFFCWLPLAAFGQDTFCTS